MNPPLQQLQFSGYGSITIVAAFGDRNSFQCSLSAGNTFSYDYVSLWWLCAGSRWAAEYHMSCVSTQSSVQADCLCIRIRLWTSSVANTEVRWIELAVGTGQSVRCIMREHGLLLRLMWSSRFPDFWLPTVDSDYLLSMEDQSLRLYMGSPEVGFMDGKIRW